MHLIQTLHSTLRSFSTPIQNFTQTLAFCIIYGHLYQFCLVSSLSVSVERAFLWAALVHPNLEYKFGTSLRVVCPTIGSVANINYRTTFVSSLPTTIAEYLLTLVHSTMSFVSKHSFSVDLFQQ